MTGPGKKGGRKEPQPPQPASGKGRAGLLANLSHELRTPMDAILGYVELLTETQLTDTQKAYASAIKDSAQGLLDIMNDVLNLAQLEAGKLEIHSQPFSVRDCIDSVSQMLAPSAYSKNLDFVGLVDPDVPINLVGDPLRIRQILVNLAGNAIKFTRFGHVRVRVSAHPYDDERYELVIRVSDTGIGLSRSDIESLFEPFSRPAAPQSNISGTGLGLVITRSLCEAMGGSVAVHSTPGVGSTFCVRVPLRALEEPHQAGAVSDSLAGRAIVVVGADSELANAISRSLQLEGASTRIVTNAAAIADNSRRNPPVYDAAILLVPAEDVNHPDDLARAWRPLRDKLPVICVASTSSSDRLRRLGELFSGDCLPGYTSMQTLSRQLVKRLKHEDRHASMPAAGDAHLLDGLRLLVAEDNQFGRDYLEMLLIRNGATVDVCGDGDTACRMLKERTYDLVLMDVRMPHCDGVTAMTRIKESWNGVPPIIGLTAAPDECSRAIGAGMTDCLVKPVRPAVLLSYLAKYRHASPEQPQSQPAFIDAEMRQELRSDLPQRASRLRESITKGNLADALEQAHKINGTAALCQFNLMRSMASSVEALLRQQKLDGIEQLSHELQEEVDRIVAALETE